MCCEQICSLTMLLSIVGSHVAVVVTASTSSAVDDALKSLVDVESFGCRATRGRRP